MIGPMGLVGPPEASLLMVSLNNDAVILVLYGTSRFCFNPGSHSQQRSAKNVSQWLECGERVDLLTNHRSAFLQISPAQQFGGTSA
jgi:hypothetical protein